MRTPNRFHRHRATFFRGEPLVASVHLWSTMTASSSKINKSETLPRARCTRAKIEPRIVGLQVREQYEALQAARRRQTTKEFQQQYAPRSGIEATHEQAVRRCGLRRSCYIGLAKTSLQHLLTATAINLVRLGEWFAGRSPAPTRRSRFAALQYA